MLFVGGGSNRCPLPLSEESHGNPYHRTAREEPFSTRAFETESTPGVWSLRRAQMARAAAGKGPRADGLGGGKDVPARASRTHLSRFRSGAAFHLLCEFVRCR